MSDTLARDHEAADFDRLIASLDDMAKEAVDSEAPSRREPASRPPSDGDLERLIAETLGVGRPRAFPIASPDERTVRAPARPADLVAPPSYASVTEGVREVAAPVEPLALQKSRRPLRAGLLAALPIAALAGGWWLAAGGLADLGLPSPFGAPATTPRSPPVIAATPTAARPAASSPPAAPAPIAPVAPPVAPAPSASAAPPVQPAPPAPVSSQAAAPRGEQPTSAIAAAESAGILGKVEPSPFDQPAAPRTVRTTAVIPPTTPAAVDAARPIDFDDPATWPAGAQRGEPHPLPPRRR